MKKLSINCSGNKKLINNGSVRFMIFNLPAISTCPFATASCKRCCYAKRAERYPSAKMSRVFNFEISKTPLFEGLIISAIDRELNKRTNNARKIVFRIHESGDFYNQEYTDKWLKIAEHYKNNKRVVFLAYTKSVRYFQYREIPKNLVVRSSIWGDTSSQNIDITCNLDLPLYTAVSKFGQGTTSLKKTAIKTGLFYECKCKDCASCGACWDRKIKNIACKIH